MTFSALRRLGLVAGSVVAILGAASVPSSAHHSTAMFLWGDEAQLTNLTVRRWNWTNPHTFIYAVDDEGNRWSFEGMSPNHLSRAGWSRRSLRPGEKVTLTYYPMRDGRRGGFNVTVVKQDGTKLTQLPSR